MKAKHIIAGVAVVLLAGAGIVVLVKSRGETSRTGDNETTRTLVTVETGALKLATMHRYVQGYGTVEPAPASSDAPTN